MRSPITKLNITISSDLEDQYRDFAHEDKITIAEAYENGLTLFIRMRNGQLNKEEINLINKMMKV